MTPTLAMLLLLPAPPAVAPAQPVRAGSPVRRVESMAAAGPMRDPLVLVDQGREDVGALGASFRMQGTDLRLPASFQRVYRVPGRDGLLMRGNGALFAVFPESVYRQTALGAMPVAPPGTVYSIGMPGALRTQPAAMSEAAADAGRAQGRSEQRHDERGGARFEGKVEGKVAGKVESRFEGKVERKAAGSAEDAARARVAGRALEAQRPAHLEGGAQRARTMPLQEERRPMPGPLDEIAPSTDPANPYARLRLGAPRVERE